MSDIAIKPHYQILDGLRGVAALTVVAFHIFEPNAKKGMLDQFINHGYLAVDFFFLLSGFVISYAYDDRWKTMSLKGFFKRRIYRLQPMIVMGMLIGAVCFYLGDSPKWPLIHTVPIWQVLLVMLVGSTLLPLPPAWDIRGWQEMHPLNGPAWSLFYEYVANILYALGLNKIPKAGLIILTALAGGYLLIYSLNSPSGDLMGGWTLNLEQLHIGFTRLIFPFLAGLLLARSVKIHSKGNTFLVSSMLLFAILAVPRLGGETAMWMNGLYESVVIILIFPFIIYLGASGEIVNENVRKICSFLGNISYPIYITHFPFIYAYSAWLSRNPGAAPPTNIMYGIATFITSVLIGFLTFKYYDVPVRKWLNNNFLNTNTPK